MQFNISIAMCVDSQVALKAQYVYVSLFWVLGHSDVVGGEGKQLAYTLEKEGSEIDLSWCHKILMPISSINFKISGNTDAYSNLQGIE